MYVEVTIINSIAAIEPSDLMTDKKKVVYSSFSSRQQFMWRESVEASLPSLEKAFLRQTERFMSANTGALCLRLWMGKKTSIMSIHCS